eukprot:TRINITY_DN8632_c0_g1_i5.p1 TRINITY_DN8632_c0_g1~~TRINITY_DN8632_c0_g1_i5.p1  ORF type:complete len:266 (+),score=71.32 TRINITY_DN8632_c0_g1_i5:250-1047(+)
MEAVKNGSICLGLKSRTHAVLCSVKRAQSELASYQEKIFKVDNQIGMAMAGLTADARLLCKYMRNECLNHQYIFNSQHPLGRLIDKVATKSQHRTQVSYKRPYGVGLLIIGVDQDGTHLFETDPSGNFYEYNAYSIGARSQSAKTYLENQLGALNGSDLETLILHGLKALKSAIQEDNELTSKSVEVAYVGLNDNFTQLTEADIEAYFTKLADFKPNDAMEVEQKEELIQLFFSLPKKKQINQVNQIRQHSVLQRSPLCLSLIHI